MDTNDWPERRRYAARLWLLLLLFILRVAGQMLVVFGRVSFLPPLEQWQSGLVPYRWLLAMQGVVIILLSKVSLDITTDRGWFAGPRALFGGPVLTLGYLYFVAMCVRYVLRMRWRRDQRWLGGIIPIVFHLVLAMYVITFGRYHRACLRARPAQGRS